MLPRFYVDSDCTQLDRPPWTRGEVWLDTCGFLDLRSMLIHVLFHVYGQFVVGWSDFYGSHRPTKTRGQAS